MAEPTVILAKPAAPSKPGAPSAFPASSGEIHVTAPVVSTKTEPEKPESAKSKMFTALKEKSSGIRTTEKPAAPTKPAATVPEAVKTAEPQMAEPGDTPIEPGQAQDPAQAASPADIKPVDKKPSPWKMVEDYKGKLARAETELAEARKSVVPEQERKSFEERITKAEARAKELEQHLTFVDYSQTEEFKDKYVAPYEKAWGTVMSELKDITINDPGTGDPRAVTASDMLQIVNMPLGKARQVAQELFGDFANDVMTHRNQIRSLFDAQNTALEEAKKNGSERIKQAREQQMSQQSELSKTIAATWEQENQSMQKDERYGQFFTPREGDEQWNERLTKGYALVDKAFNENPRDPKLTPEERAKVIRRHAAVRNRAASWGAVRGENEILRAQVKSLTEELGQYKESEPGAAGDRRPALPGLTGGGSAKDRLFSALKEKARSA